MSDYKAQPVTIKGGTYFIGVMIWFLCCKACDIHTRLEEIRDRMPKSTLAEEKAE